MFKPRWMKVWRDLWGNPTRTALIVISVAAGLFAIGVIVNTKIILDEGLHQAYAAIHPSQDVIRTAQTFDKSFVQSVRRVPGVAEAEGRGHFWTRFQLQPAGAAADGRWRDLQIFAVPDYDALRVDKIQPQAGAWPPPAHTLLLERASLDLLGARVGDALIVETPDGHTRVVPITGAVHDLAQLPASFDNSVYAYVSYDTLDWLGQPQGLNELQIAVVQPASQAQVQVVINRVKDKVEESGLTIPMELSARASEFPLNDILQAVLLMLGGLGVLSLFLSAFLIVNTISALVTQQFRQIAVMKAIGARDGQVFSLYLVLVAAYGVIALVLAVPLSLFGAQALSQTLAGMFNFDLLGFRVAPEAIGLQVAIGLLTPVLAAIYPALGALRLSVAEVLRGAGAGQAPRGVLDRLLTSPVLSRLAPRPVLLSLRNTFRRKARLVLTLAALTLGGAIFIGVLSVRTSLDETMRSIMQAYQFDLWVVLAAPQNAGRAEQRALETPHVVEAKGWNQFPVRCLRADGSEGGTIYLMAPQVEAGLLTPAMLQGRWLQPQDDHAIVISTGILKDEPDLRVGGDLVLKLEGRNVTFHIVGLALGMGLAPNLYAGYADVARITHSGAQTDYLMVVTGRSAVSAQAQDAAALEAHFKQNGLRVSSIQLMTEEGGKIQSGFSIVIVLALVMACLLAFVGGLGLMGTLSINVLERTREIGVMRAIGASDGAVARVFIVEGEVIGLISWLLGTLLAIPLSAAMSHEVGLAFLQSPLTNTFSTEGVWLWLVIVVVLAAGSSLWPARNAAQLTVRDALAYE